MKLFISWSGERSRILAESLGNWIPKVINAVEPWLSARDIDPGSRWSPEIAGQLEQTKFGIICLTSDNLVSTWIHFESGALSKLVDKSKVVPLLLDNNPVDIQGPLSQFQAVKVNKDDIKKLMTAINIAVSAAGEKGIDKVMLEEAFEVWWPKIEANLMDIPKSDKKAEELKRSEREMIEEILGLVRSMARDSSWDDIRLILPLVSSSKFRDEYKRKLARLYNTISHGSESSFTNLVKFYSLLNDVTEDTAHKPPATKALDETSEEKSTEGDENADSDNLLSDPTPSTK